MKRRCEIIAFDCSSSKPVHLLHMSHHIYDKLQAIESMPQQQSRVHDMLLLEISLSYRHSCIRSSLYTYSMFSYTGVDRAAGLENDCSGHIGV